LLRFLLSFLVLSLSFAPVTATKADEDEPHTPPAGSTMCLAFGNLLDGAWFSAGLEPKLANYTTDKALKFIDLANWGEFTVVQPEGGLTFIPADLDDVRAAAANLGYDFRPAKWEAEPNEVARIYSEDMDFDYVPDLVIERRKSTASCSGFEFWHSDTATGVLSRMPSPEGWESCGSFGSEKEEIRLLANFYGEVTIPMLAVGKGLMADFYLYRLNQKSSAKTVFSVPALCRVRLEPLVDIVPHGNESCSRFGQLARSALFDGSYAIGEPVKKLLILLQSRSPYLELPWWPVVRGERGEDVRSTMIELGLSPEVADLLIARFTRSAPTVWVSQGQAQDNSAKAVIQGIASSGQVLTLLVRSAENGITVSQLPLIWVTSDSSQDQTWPLIFERRPFLLQSRVRSPENLELALTPLGAAEPHDGDCRLVLNDKGMKAGIKYDPNDQP
jgi:hypothetical protein